MLREAKILVPMQDNNGRDLSELHAHIADVLTEHFGGLTVIAAQGAWRSPETGKLYREPMAAYILACEGDEQYDGSDISVLLRGVAGWIAKSAGQECVYLQQPGARVEFVTRDAAPLVAGAALGRETVAMPRPPRVADGQRPTLRVVS